MHQEPWKQQRWLALIRESTAHRQAIASDRLGFLVLTPGHAPFNLTHAARVLLELGLGVMVSLDDWFSSLLEIVELAELVRNAWQDLLHSQLDRTLSVRKNTLDRHRQSILDLAQQVGEVLSTSTVERAGKQDFA